MQQVQQQSATFNKILGKRLRLQRKLHCMTQVDLADLLGVSQPTYSDIEAGNRPLQVYELCLLVERLSISMRDLVPVMREATKGPV